MLSAAGYVARARDGPTSSSLSRVSKEALEKLVDPLTRGDPESPLRWTCKSRAKLTAALSKAGWKVSSTTVSGLLHELGYSLQSVRKSREGTSQPDRNAQFEHINTKADEFLQRGEPVVSVDTKKKELVGEFSNAGQEWQPKGRPEKSLVHDFPQDSAGKAIPYGIYDMAHNEAWVNIGRDHDTPAFAVASLRRWWNEMGKRRYPEAGELFITRRCGREQRISFACLEAWTAEVRGRDASVHPRQPFPAGHEQVEQDRAPTVLPHHAPLARQTSTYLRDHCRPDRKDANGRGASGQSQARQEKVPYWRSHNERADERPVASSKRVPRRLELRTTSTMKLEM